MEKILIIGRAIFIGSHFVDATMTREINVSVLDNFSSGTLKNIKP